VVYSKNAVALYASLVNDATNRFVEASCMNTTLSISCEGTIFGVNNLVRLTS
jgi:hypothetical protein